MLHECKLLNKVSMENKLSNVFFWMPKSVHVFSTKQTQQVNFCKNLKKSNKSISIGSAITHKTVVNPLKCREAIKIIGKKCTSTKMTFFITWMHFVMQSLMVSTLRQRLIKIHLNALHFPVDILWIITAPRRRYQFSTILTDCWWMLCWRAGFNPTQLSVCIQMHFLCTKKIEWNIPYVQTDA